MQIYGIAIQDGKLAIAGVFAFLEFLDQSYRDRDYGRGRKVAQQRFGSGAFKQPGQIGLIRYTPALCRPSDGTWTALLAEH